MRTRVTVCILFLVLGGIMMSFTKQGIPRHVSRKLKRDAARLAIRMESHGEDLALQSITIPRETVDKMYKILANVYSSKLDEAGTVFDCNIRAATDVSIDKFWIIYKKDAEWAEDLEDGIFEAGGDVGDLLDEYDLFITKKNLWKADQNIITIESARLYNIQALIQKFQRMDGVVDVVTNNSAAKPDSDIEIIRMGRTWKVSFSKKWTSLGKRLEHVWAFSVDPRTKRVKLVGESGDEIPDWMECQLSMRR